MSHFGRLVLPLTLCRIRLLNLSSAEKPSEKAASAPAEPATSETEVSVRSSPRDHDFLGQLEGKKYWWDAVAQRPLLQTVPGQETGRGFRSVINLRGQNSYTKKRTFMMATLKNVSQSIREGDWAATIDPEDAYLHARAYCKGLRMFIRLISFQFRRLPFSSAPRTFTTISLPVVAMCRAKGIRLIAYLDNFLVLALNCREAVGFSHQYSLRHFRPGWIPAKHAICNPDKSSNTCACSGN